MPLTLEKLGAPRGWPRPSANSTREASTLPDWQLYVRKKNTDKIRGGR
jgi:hypothetical protein